MTPQDPTCTGAVATGAAFGAGRLRAIAAEGDPRARFTTWLRLWLPWNQALEVIWTHNRSTMVSYRRRCGGLHLRLHVALAQAGPQVAQALAAFVLGAPRAQHVALRKYIAQLQLSAREAGGGVVSPPARAPRRPILRPCGAVHDLTQLAAAVNRAYFSDASTAAITWGRAAPPSRRRRSMVLGSYHAGLHLIRIHPALDQPFVPAYVVSGVIFHEMLHEAMGFGEGSGRRALHPPAFVAREQAYPDFARCRAWEGANIGRLLAVRP